MGRYWFADYVFLGSLACISFFAFTTGHPILVLLMVAIGAWAAWTYVWRPARQRQIQPLVNKAQAARDMGNAKEAVRLYDQAIAQQPKNSALYLERGQVKLAEKAYSAALADFQQASRLTPQNPGIHLMITTTYCGLKEYQKALTLNNEMINANPNGLQAFMGYLGRGTVFIYLRKFDRALGDFLQADKLKPDFFLTQGCLAEAFCYIGEFSKGLASAERALELMPSWGTSYLWRGWAKYGLGHYEEGLKDCNTAIQQDPKFGKSYEIRGLIHRSMGQLALALKDLELALELYRKEGLEQFEAEVMEPLAEVRQALGKDLTDME
jgi:tetratricopeptide (TPR) repeat protein